MDSDREGKSAKRQKMNTDITALCQAGPKQGHNFLHLPTVSLAKVASFLDFGELLMLRGVCTDLKTVAHGVLQKSAMEDFSRVWARWPFRFMAHSERCGTVTIQLKQGWTEEFRTLDGVVRHALMLGDLRYFLRDSKLEKFAKKLKKIALSVTTLGSTGRL